MTVLFAGQEDISFSNTNTIVSSAIAGSWYTDTTAGVFRSGYARYALSYYANTGSTNNYLVNRNPFSSGNFWTTTRVSNRWNNSAVTSSTIVPMFWSDPGGTPKLRIRFNGTGNTPNSYFVVEKLNAAGTITQIGSTSTGIFNNSSNTSPCFTDKIDVYINYAVSGQFTFYLNGVIIFTYSGDVTTDSTTTLGFVNIGTAMNNNAGQYLTSWSEVIVSTKQTTNMSLVTRYPSLLSQNGAVSGNTVGFYGNYIDYQKVVASYTGTLSSVTMSLQTAPAGTYKFGVYNDSSGPNTLLGSGSVVNPSTGLCTVSMSGGSITVGNTYWVAVLNTASGTVFYSQGTYGFVGAFYQVYTNTLALPATATPVAYPGALAVSDGQIWAAFTVAQPASTFTSTGTTVSNEQNNVYQLSSSSPDTSNTANQLQTYGTSPALPSIGIYTIRAIVHQAWVGNASTGPQNFQFITTIGGTNYYSSIQSLSPDRGLVSYSWETNPNTSAKWLTTDLVFTGANPFEIGYKSIT